MDKAWVCHEGLTIGQQTQQHCAVDIGSNTLTAAQFNGA